MKTIGVEMGTLDACVRDAQNERVVLTRNGVPVALMVGIEGLDVEQVQLAGSDDFWRWIAQRRQQKTLTRAELEHQTRKAG
jgi:antitoxin (DNA-binding transcriptional repressor) of toxin-antitoxin stability system